MDSSLTVSQQVLDRYIIWGQIRQAKDILSMIAESKLNANAEAKCFLDDSSKDIASTSPEEGAGGYNHSVPRMLAALQGWGHMFAKKL